MASTRRTLAIVAGALGATAAIALAFWRAAPSRHPELPADEDARVRALCSGCHVFPEPEILPRAVWRTQIEHMEYLRDYLPSPEGDAPAFSVDEIAAWYEARAPEKLPVERKLTRDGPPPLRFDSRFALLGPGSGPGVATVETIDVGTDANPKRAVAAPNMMSGAVHLFTLRGGPVRVGAAGHPVRVSSGDLNGDGRRDLVISDLGKPMPTDDLLGRVLVGIATGTGGYELEPILEEVGRIADARPLDVDGDGDLDVVAVAFGWHRAGGVYLLHNETSPPGPLAFRVEQLSERSGGVSVAPLPEARGSFAVAFSQHHEIVSVFEREPDSGSWSERIVYRAPHPNWGTSNLEPVDLDGDGDTDFLMAHGDTLDDGVAFKFYHGVEWIENLGDGRFRATPIGTLYGAHRSEAADVDGDGDLDVVAVGFLPQVQLPVPRGGMRVDSVVWFERDGDEWIPWSIEFDHPRHTGATTMDLDGDGRIDVITAINTAWDAKAVEKGPSLELWFNRGPP